MTVSIVKGYSVWLHERIVDPVPLSIEENPDERVGSPNTFGQRGASWATLFEVTIGSRLIPVYTLARHARWIAPEYRRRRFLIFDQHPATQGIDVCLLVRSPSFDVHSPEFADNLVWITEERAHRGLVQQEFDEEAVRRFVQEFVLSIGRVSYTQSVRALETRFIVSDT